MFGKISITTLNRRLLLLLLVFGTLPLALAGYVLIRLERQTLVEQAKRELNNISKSVGRELDTYLHELLLDAQAIASLPDIRSLEPARQEPVLAGSLALYNRYGQLAIVDLSGQILLTGREQEKVNIQSIDSFRQAAAGEQSWFIAPGLFNNNLVMHMHTPILGADGRPAAVLGSPVPLTNLASLLIAGHQSKDYEVFVLGADHRVLVHPNLDQQLNRTSYADLMAGEAGAALPAAASGLAFEDDAMPLPTTTILFRDGVEYLYSSQEIPHLGWTIVASRPMKSILELTSTTMAIAFTTVMFTLLAGNLLAIVFTTRLTIPISRLADAALGLKSGESNIPLPSTAGKDEEIRVLIEAFTAMRTAVTEREKELRELSATLEDRVRSRTRELLLTNQKLAIEIDKHRDTAEALQAAIQSAEAASRAKSAFLATMSHELRTPLTAIIGYSEMLVDEAIFRENDDALEDLESIVRSARHLLQIINDVLLMARIESEGLEIANGFVNLPQIVSDAINKLAPLIDQNENRVDVELTPELSMDIRSDESKVYQILWNLLSNAVKFTHGGEIKLSITLDREFPFLDDPAQWLVICVTDSGIGIPVANQARLFEPFMQVDSSNSRRYPGTGLGLALTSRLCRLMGGEIFFESKLHHGSTFTVRLPLQQELVKQV